MKFNIITPTKGLKDVFNLFMIKDCRLVGNLEIPYIEKYNGPLPTKITNYNAKKANLKKYFVHFYLYDYCFDGKNGLWNGSCFSMKKTERIYKKLGEFQGIITPDYSVYVDMPLIMQYWNIYRARVIYYWLRKQGFTCIFNIRWGDYRTYDIAFFGIEKNSTLAIGSHGLIKNKIQRSIFMDGFVEMIKRLEPLNLIIYGPYTKEMKSLCATNNINVVNFDSEQTEARK